jgi:peptidoglycan/xylan/chitin deacetylase (PgdA/CDA1 family)
MAIAQKMVNYAMRADSGLGTLRRFLFGEKPGLLTVLFHNIFHDESVVTSGLAYPQEGVTQAQFRTFLDCWQRAGYRFVSLGNIIAGLDEGGRYVHLTFDDGYSSILDILPILEEYQAPATLFVTSYNIETGHAFRPDVVYREGIAQGRTESETSAIIESLKSKSSAKVQKFMLERYGEAALSNADSLARPLTADEIAGLATHPLIDIGNHTMNHINLTECSLEEKRSQISGCQKAVEIITGKTPVAISYPYGNFNDEVLDVARAEGLLLGITCEEGKNRLPLNENLLKLYRYDFLGELQPSVQFERFRSDVHLFWPAFKKLLLFLTTHIHFRFGKG